MDPLDALARTDAPGKLDTVTELFDRMEPDEVAPWLPIIDGTRTDPKTGKAYPISHVQRALSHATETTISVAAIRKWRNTGVGDLRVRYGIESP